MQQRQFAALTGIRGAAATWVVCFHAYPPVGQLFGWPERAQVPVVRDGFLGVDLFFVLSGFVLSLAYNERFQENFGRSFREFFFGRFFRIFPLHWVCLALFVLLATSFPHYWWGPGPFTFSALVASAALVQNWTSSTAMAWNHPTWSLSAEWLVYLLFPFLTAISRRLHDHRLAVAGSLLSLFVLDALLLGRGSTNLDHVGPAGMARCLCEFTAGAFAWAALSANDRHSRVLGETFAALGVALLVLAVAVPATQIAAPFAFVMLIVGCASSGKLPNWLFGNRLILFLGEISFSIYLVHIIVLGCLAAIVERFHIGGANLSIRLGVTIAFPLLVLTVAYLTWRFVEKPCQEFARRHVRGSRYAR